jgi:hypothetical protein
VAAVARRLGVAPATLRTWHRRYGLGPSDRTSGSHRRYGLTDVARLDLMRRLVHNGVPPADAARIALATEDDALPSLTFPPGVPLPGPSVTAGIASGYATVPGPVRPGGPLRPSGPASGLGAAGAGPPPEPGQPAAVDPADLDPVARGLTRAALALDGPGCTDLIVDGVGRHGVVWTWDRMLVPLLVAVGDRWSATGDGIEVEHLVSESIIMALTGVCRQLRAPVNARPVLLACGGEETHSLPLFALAAALTERSIAARVLGARVPHQALVAAIRRVGPAAVVVSSHVAPASRESLAPVCSVRPSPLVLAAGRGWTGTGPEGVVDVHDLGDAVHRIGSVVR